ncbi:MAG: FecCD family ABC transporter permease [Velocimicrobium sp.]
MKRKINQSEIQSGKKSTLIWILFLIAPLMVAFTCMMIGRFSLSVKDVIEQLWLFVTQGREAMNPQYYSVILQLRLPRILLAGFCGAGLAASGCAYQNLFSNALATPDTLGVASGASFGAVLGLLWNQNLFVVQILAIVFGLVAVALTYLISHQKGESSIIMIILAGMVISAIFNALISLVKFTADAEEQLPSITYWLMGSCASANYKSLLLCTPFIIVGILILFFLRFRLNLLCLSDDEAQSNGVHVGYLRAVTSIAATIVTASCVSMCGQVGWVGLLIPHICRMLFGSNTTKIIPASISLGAIFMLIIDAAARSASSVEIPISILTALIGAPVFILLLRKTGGTSL